MALPRVTDAVAFNPVAFGAVGQLLAWASGRLHSRQSLSGAGFAAWFFSEMLLFAFIIWIFIDASNCRFLKENEDWGFSVLRIEMQKWILNHLKNSVFKFQYCRCCKNTYLNNYRQCFLRRLCLPQQICEHPYDDVQERTFNIIWCFSKCCPSALSFGFPFAEGFSRVRRHWVYIHY